MALLRIAEVFGYSTENDTQDARQGREARACPFKSAPCTKDSKKDPLGVCSLSDGNKLAVLCPSRFVEGGRIFTDVGRLAFGNGVRIIAAPEVSVLRAKASSLGGRSSPSRLGKVDYLIARLDANGKPVDFAALEVQAVYFSGESIRPPFNYFLANRSLPPDAERRPDWRSSAQKRLMPQLALKTPLFRRWGKKVFVAVDSRFFDALPSIPTDECQSFENSEVTWMVYPFDAGDEGYHIGRPRIVFTFWDDVLTALREGVAPAPAEVIADIERKQREKNLPVLTT